MYPVMYRTTLYRHNCTAGSSHEVTLAEMKPAEKVIREKRRQARRQRLGGGAAAAAAGGDVLDV